MSEPVLMALEGASTPVRVLAAEIAQHLMRTYEGRRAAEVLEAVVRAAAAVIIAQSSGGAEADCLNAGHMLFQTIQRRVALRPSAQPEASRVLN